MRSLTLAFVCFAAASALGQRQIKLTVLDAVPGNETAASVERLVDGHIAILGKVQTKDNRVRLYLLDGTNRLVFSRPLTIGLPGDEFPGTIASVDAGHFLTTYVALSNGQYRTVVAMVRTDGGLDWQVELPAVGNSITFERPPRAAVGPGGLIVVAYEAQGQSHVARVNSIGGALLGETLWPGDDGTGSTPFGLDVRGGAIWLGVQNGLGLVSRYGLVKFNLSGQFLWAKSQTQDVINILGPAWIRGLEDGTAVIVAGEEGPFGSHRTTVTRYSPDGLVLNRRMDPPANINSGGALRSASILPNGLLAYSLILGGLPVLELGRADGSVAWQNDVTGQLGESGSAHPTTVDLDPLTVNLAVSHDALGFSVFTKRGSLFWDESLPVSGECVRSVWGARGTIVTVINAGGAVDQQITVFSRTFVPGP